MDEAVRTAVERHEALTRAEQTGQDVEQRKQEFLAAIRHLSPVQLVKYVRQVEGNR